MADRRPFAIAREKLREQGAAHVAHYAGEHQHAILTVEASPDVKARWAIEESARREAATRKRKPTMLTGEQAKFQSVYDAAFVAEKRRRAWPRGWP